MCMLWTGDLDPITKKPFPEPIPRPEFQGKGIEDDPSKANPRRRQHRRRSAGSCALLHVPQGDLQPMWRYQMHAYFAGTRKSLPVHANGIANYFKVLPVSREAQRDFAAPRMFPGTCD